jgi:adenylylsulfate kinase
MVLDKDLIRGALFPADEIDYTTAQDDLCMRVMIQVAAYILTKDASKHIILDGRTFSRRYQLDEWKHLARQLDVSIAVIECVCRDTVVRERLQRDAATNMHPAANRDYAMYLEVKARSEGVAGPKCVIDTEQCLGICVRQALDYVETVRDSASPDGYE